MSNEILSSPISTDPAGRQRVDPPIIAISNVNSVVADASQSVLDHVWECINDVSATAADAEQAVRDAIVKCIEHAEEVYTSTGNLISADVMAKVGFIASQVNTLPIEEVTVEEIHQRASAIPWQGGPLPPLPRAIMPFIPTPAPRIIEVPVPGRPIGTLQNPGPSQQYISTFVPYGTATPGVTTPGGGPGVVRNVPGGGGTGQSTVYGTGGGGGGPGAPGPSAGGGRVSYGTGGGPGGGQGTGGVVGAALSTAPAAAGYGTPGPQLPPLNRDAVPPPVGPGPLPPYGTPTAPAGQTVQQQQATQQQPCPPVNVVIHCAPGATATQQTTEVDESTTSTTNQQFIKSDIELDRSLPEQRRTPPPPPAKRDVVNDSTSIDGVSLVGAPKDAMKLPPLPTGGAGTPWDQLFKSDLSGILDQLLTPKGCEALAKLDVTARMAVGQSAASWWGYKPDGTVDDNTILGRAVTSLPGVLQGIASVLVGVTVGQFSTAWKTAANVAGCTSPLFPAIAGMRSLVGFVETWVGAPFPEAMNRLEQIAGQVCPTAIPSVAEADRAWYVGAIDEATWRCWVRANGVRDDLQKIVRTAGEARPSPDQMYAYTLRKGIPTEQSLDYLKWSGVQEWQTWDAIVELAKYVPGPGDLVRFMVRDVFDESIVQKYQYDEEFTSKFSGKAVEWARSQGMTAEQFRYYWRAHWQLPSPGQGYTMIHRLRKGVVDDHLVTDEATISQLLEVNDYPKYWRDRLIAISYHPIGRIDARRSYFIGTLDDEGLVNAFMDLGYNESNARKMLLFYRAERIEWLLNRPLSRAYMKGELSDSELYEWIATLNLAPNTQDLFEQRLEIQSKLVQRRGTLKAIKTRVVRGITDWIDAQQELIQLGYRAARSSKLAQSWDEERKAHGKYPAANQLCRMYAKGIIDVGTYSEALLRLGYDAVDVQRIMALGCNTKGEGAVPLPGAAKPGGALPVPPDVKQTAAAARAKQAAVARAARQRNAMSKAEETVQKRLTQTNMELVKAFGGSPTDYASTVRALFDVLRNDKCYTRDGASSLIKELVGDLAKRRRRDWQAIAEGYLSQMTPRPCPPPDNGGLPAGAEALAEPEG